MSPTGWECFCAGVIFWGTLTNYDGERVSRLSWETWMHFGKYCGGEMRFWNDYVWQVIYSQFFLYLL
jgi:hypothetical protein